MAGLCIVPARSDGQIAQARELFGNYVDWLARGHAISLAFQGIDEELASLPGKYAPPEGDLLLGVDATGRALGCVAVRPFAADTCEIKRLYVLDLARGTGLGRRLASEILGVARALGYRRALLDTAPFMAAAQRVYRDLGFREIAPYYHNPLPGCRFMACDLGATPPA